MTIDEIAEEILNDKGCYDKSCNCKITYGKDELKKCPKRKRQLENIKDGYERAINDAKKVFDVKIEKVEQEKAELQEENIRLKDLVIKMGTTIKTNEDMWKYFESRFVKVNTCTEEMKKDCLMFQENFCEGERCNEWVDLVDLLDKATDKGDVK